VGNEPKQLIGNAKTALSMTDIKSAFADKYLTAARTMVKEKDDGSRRTSSIAR
jgi:hypothetical protein